MNTIKSQYIIFLFASLFLYVLYRAIVLSFTHDESVSYFLATGDLYWYDTPNNHILNTYLLKFFTIFGNKEWILRLPNVILFISYSYFTFHILKFSKSKLIFTFGFSLMMLNPFVLEYFSLARGYGLSMGFLLASIYFLISLDLKTFDSDDFLRKASFSFSFASFSICANLALINYYISIYIILSLYLAYHLYFQKKEIKTIFKYILLLTIALVPLLLATKRLLYLNSLNQLSYGTESLYQSFRSIIAGTLYYLNTNVFLIHSILFFISFSFIGNVFLLFFYKNSRTTPFLFINVLFFFLVSGLIFENYLFNVKYPYERTAIYFLPIFSLVIYYFFVTLFEAFPILEKLRFSTILLLFSTLNVLNFLYNFNIVSTYTWRYDRYSKEIMNQILEHSSKNDQKIHVNVHWLFEPSMRYFKASRGLHNIYFNLDDISPKSKFIFKFLSDPKPEKITEIGFYDGLDLTNSNECCAKLYINPNYIPEN